MCIPILFLNLSPVFSSPKLCWQSARDFSLPVLCTSHAGDERWTNQTLNLDQTYYRHLFLPNSLFYMLCMKHSRPLHSSSCHRTLRRDQFCMTCHIQDICAKIAGYFKVSFFFTFCPLYYIPILVGRINWRRHYPLYYFLPLTFYSLGP